MGVHILENDYLKVSIADVGAELSSVFDKETNRERLWNGDPAVWNRHAPILFPFVGRVIGGVYRIGNREYTMKTQHGFARDMEFDCVEITGTSVTHRLLPTDATREIYPFEFELLVKHSLDIENPRLLRIDWEVKNNGGELMYYSIGGHPGFMIPEEERKEDYYIEFPGRDDLKYISVNPENGFAAPDKVFKLETENGFIKFNDTIPDTWIFDYQNIETIRIARPDKTPCITMKCGQFPFLAVWAKKTGPFICLEPWMGRTDDDGFCGTLEEKTGMEKLEADSVNKISYTVEFHK